MSEAKHSVQCPTCERADLESPWKFYVPGHTAPGTDATCDGSDKGTKPNYSADRRRQLCFKCGKYSGRNKRFCPHCDK